jgi:hypothetical protein
MGDDDDDFAHVNYYFDHDHFDYDNFDNNYPFDHDHYGPDDDYHRSAPVWAR